MNCHPTCQTCAFEIRVYSLDASLETTSFVWLVLIAPLPVIGFIAEPGGRQNIIRINQHHTLLI